MTTVAGSAQAVRGPAGRVVVIFWGADAADAAAEWTARGYRVDTIDREALGD
jgi:hypothetical protein